MKPAQGIEGIDHVFLISADPERTARFYIDVLGLQPANSAGHAARVSLAAGNGSPIIVIASTNEPVGRIGIGVLHHLALTAGSADTLLKWKRWLQRNQVPVLGPYNQQAYQDIILADPDGVLIEIATDGPGWGGTGDGAEVYTPPMDTMAPYRDEGLIDVQTWQQPVTSIEPDMMLRGLHHVAAIVSSLPEAESFYSRALGIPLVRKTMDTDDSEVQNWYWGPGGGRPGSIITAFPIMHEDEGGTQVYGRLGPGVAHHFALRVAGDDLLTEWSNRLVKEGLEATRTRDDAGHASLTVHGPDGQIVELTSREAG